MAKFCPNCGTENEEGAGFCTECGSNLKTAEKPKKQPKRHR